ncbi:MAG TPA: ATP-grasp domain-containing protein [Fimbriimonadaceae bacterium]|nr:ATP-grasp domain-containing protein [Fimbriimonadaceae bacterium]
MSGTYDLGFLGGGQLARMSIHAAQRMGLKCLSLDPGRDTPASQVADALHGSLDDPEAIREVLSACERVTLENEFISGHAIRRAFKLSGRPEGCLIPGIETLETIQDKLLQREAFLQNNVPSPRAVAIKGDGEAALIEIGLPLVLKARCGGYDGKGTLYARTREEWDAHQPTWSKGGWMAEEFVPFRRELAVMVAVGPGYEHTFPTVETVQKSSVCDLVFPCDADASEVALNAVRAVKGLGLFGVELFQLEDGRCLVNEMAPRPHNSGHYTLDWGGPSQFEFHVRTVLGLSAEKPESSGFAVMANLFGQVGATDLRAAAAEAIRRPRTYFHWYGKVEAKPGRKMGHINAAGLAGESVETVKSRAEDARRAFYETWIAGK